MNLTFLKEKSSLYTIGIMLLVVISAILYVLSIDESAIQKRNNTPAAQALLIDDPAKSFTNLNGEPVVLTDYFGKILVVSSWASWCPQCTADLNQLGPLAEAYKDKDVIVLAVNRAEDRYTAERFLKSVTISPGLVFILDPSDHFFTANVGYAMPETILYNKDGGVALHQRGNLQVDELRLALDSLLNE